MIPILVIVACFIASTGLARLLVRLAPRLGLLDVPNERSSHERVTPRGGGIAIALAGLGGMAVLAATSNGHATIWLAFAGAGLVVSVIGLIDDRRGTPAGVRFLVQFGASTLVIAVGATIREVEIPVIGIVPLGFLAIPLTLLWLVGHANLFNFMDGIDGLAAGHAVAAGAFLGGWGLAAAEPVTGWGGLLVAAASLGFLMENRPPARIFMGDVGSLFLGLLLAALAARGASVDSGVAFPVSFLLLGPFIYDAAFTLGRRIRAGEDVLRAHRSHLYQRLVIAGHPHAVVTALYVGLTLVCGGLGTLYRVSPPSVGLGILGGALAMMVGVTRIVNRVEKAGGSHLG